MTVTAPTVPVSTVPAAFTYLASAIQAQLNTDPDAADILLTVGDPSADAPDVYVEIGSDVRRQVHQITEGKGWNYGTLEENYDIDIIVSVAQQALDVVTDTLAVVQRAWQIVGYVETAVRLDLSLGQTVRTAVPLQSRGGAPKWAPNNVARICEIVVPIHCTASI